MQKYISFDVETGSDTPGKGSRNGGSMLSLGACPVDDIDTTFYSEIQPISSYFVPDRMRYGSMGLECLVRYKEIDPTCNPLHSDFIPARVLEILKEHGERPKDTMERYALWIRSVSEGEKPIEAAAPLRFDSMWTTWYFRNFYKGANPFGPTGGMDIASFHKGVVHDTSASFKETFRTKEATHNALDDAIQQAREFQQILALLKN